MREREAQLELAKKRQGNENSDTSSICSSNGGNIQNDSTGTTSTVNNTEVNSTSNKDQIQQQTLKLSVIDISPKEEKLSTFERKKLFENEGRVASKLELFEKGSTSMDSGKYRQSLNDELKNSVLKIHNTIDSYLKDKRNYEALYENTGDATSTSNSLLNRDTDLRKTYETITTSTVTNRQSKSSFQDTASISGISCTRSEYGTARYGFNNSSGKFFEIFSYFYLHIKIF